MLRMKILSDFVWNRKSENSTGRLNANNLLKKQARGKRYFLILIMFMQVLSRAEVYALGLTMLSALWYAACGDDMVLNESAVSDSVLKDFYRITISTLCP